MLPYNYTIFDFRALYEPKNDLKRKVSIFYAVASTQKPPTSTIFLLSHAHTCARIKKNRQHLTTTAARIV
jgi:hypothetical protein